MKNIKITITGLFALLLASCGDNSNKEVSNSHDIYEKTFSLVFEGEWEQYSEIYTEENATLHPYIIISKRNEVGLSAGCNIVSGVVDIDTEEKIMVFGDMISTQMYCEGFSEVENSLQEAFAQTASYSKEEGTISLIDIEGTTLVSFIETELEFQ